MTFEYMLNERERKGLELGRSAGVAQEKREIAKSMKAKKIPTADIAEITGLSKEEVEALQGLPVISLFKNTQMTRSACGQDSNQGCSFYALYAAIYALIYIDAKYIIQGFFKNFLKNFLLFSKTM